LLTDKEKETKYKVRKFMVRPSGAALAGVSRVAAMLRTAQKYTIPCCMFANAWSTMQDQVL